MLPGITAFTVIPYDASSMQAVRMKITFSQMPKRLS
jgi:hypothetical protein